MANLPADLPENWTQGQIISPNGTEVGLTEQHGYNYLNAQVNAAQSEINTINTSLADVAQEATVDEINEKIGETNDTGGTSTAGSVMGKLNGLFRSINSGYDTSYYMPLDQLIAAATGYLPDTNIVEYTSPGQYSLNIPYGCSKIKVSACGAGGGGALCTSAISEASCGGGGAGQCIKDVEYNVEQLTSISITIGNGGEPTPSGSGSTYGNGTNGGSTIIGDLVTLVGGNGGSYNRQSGTTAQSSGAAGGTGYSTGVLGNSGGEGGYSTTSQSVSQSSQPTFVNGENGEDSTNGYTGGTGGVGYRSENGSTGNYYNFYGGGGGGASMFGNGGNGASGEKNTSSSNPQALSIIQATAGGFGAGGGGGGSGGDGGSGYCKIEFISAI
nr:MAG TPA: hypothetical protein [Caudoviricetes sp.]